jgi:hypothetical protein
LFPAIPPIRHASSGRRNGEAVCPRGTSNQVSLIFRRQLAGIGCDPLRQQQAAEWCRAAGISGDFDNPEKNATLFVPVALVPADLPSTNLLSNPFPCLSAEAGVLNESISTNDHQQT